MKTKADLRVEIKLRIKQLSQQQRVDFDKQILINLVHVLKGLRHNFPDKQQLIVAGHFPLADEPRLDWEFVNSQIPEIFWVYPIHQSSQMQFAPCASPSADTPFWGEPTGEVMKPHVLIIPALAYDSQGFRLGRGKGFYDRYLGQGPSQFKTVGVSYDHAEVGNWPIEDHDHKVDIVISEKGIFGK